MSSTPLQSLWDASASQPFTPTISKEQQFTVGFALLFAALVLTGLFGMNNSLKNLPLFAVPASLTFGFGAVYMICAVGVYV
ncbi:hypothetical protein MBLNU13_g03212t1 [Cladosporium sp. NU13]